MRQISETNSTVHEANIWNKLNCTWGKYLKQTQLYMRQISETNSTVHEANIWNQLNCIRGKYLKSFILGKDQFAAIRICADIISIGVIILFERGDWRPIWRHSWIEIPRFSLKTPVFSLETPSFSSETSSFSLETPSFSSETPQILIVDENLGSPIMMIYFQTTKNLFLYRLATWCVHTSN